MRRIDWVLGGLVHMVLVICIVAVLGFAHNGRIGLTVSWAIAAASMGWAVWQFHRLRRRVQRKG